MFFIMGGNIRLLIVKFDMNVKKKNIVKAWDERKSKNEELVRVVNRLR